MTPQRRVQLHTDAILKRSGVNGVFVKVRLHNHRWRITEIHVQDKNGCVPDTYAVTLLTPKYWTPEIKAINACLIETASASLPMGVMFRNTGAVVQQNRRLLLRLPIPAKLAVILKVRLAEIEIYEFFADSNLYGRIVEIRKHHRRRPDRHWRGSYRIARFFGIPSSTFTDWLDGQKPRLYHRLVIMLGILGGIPSDIVLLIRVLHKSE